MLIEVFTLLQKNLFSLSLSTFVDGVCNIHSRDITFPLNLYSIIVIVLFSFQGTISFFFSLEFFPFKLSLKWR